MGMPDWERVVRFTVVLLVVSTVVVVVSVRAVRAVRFLLTCPVGTLTTWEHGVSAAVTTVPGTWQPWVSTQTGV